MAQRTADELEHDLAPEALGPYRITGLLARGGMGVVYRAVHAESGASVALKTVSALDPSRLSALRGEIDALAGVRHPGVAGLVDHGVERGRPWYAMELFEGRTLRDLLRERHADGIALDLESATRPAPPARLPAASSANRCAPAAPSALVAEELGLFARLCEALAFLHGRGIVHRDLKPENVFLRADGVPVLMDLGIAGRFAAAEAREPLHPADAAGSAAYMAPEQIRGELTDARADLYALGCMLYEIVAGAPPFTGPGAVRGHLESRPAPLSAHAPEVPRALERLVARLLAKGPEDRPGYALDVARELDALAGHSRLHGAGEPALHLHRPGFVGRAVDLARLQAAVARAARGERGERVFIAGESGIGKTRLAMEAAQRAAAEGMVVVVASASAEAGTTRTPDARALQLFAPLLLAVADRCRADPGVAERLLGERATVLAPYQPALDERRVPHEELPAERARDRVLDALVATVVALARERPLLLVLDDLQWADPLSMAALGRLRETDALLVIGTYRSEEASPALRGLSLERIELRRLEARDIDAVVSGLLGSPAPAELLAFVHRRCGGNPFFAAEHVRALMGEGLLERDRGGRWRVTARDGGLEGAGLPDTLSALIARRLLGLDAATRQVARAAAVLGRELDVAVLVQVAGRAAAEPLATLRERQILEDAGPGRVRFVHDRIREVTYARTSPAARRALHARAAAALEARLEPSPAALAALGHHLARAGAHRRASEVLLRAGEGARALHANEDAARLFGAAARAARKARALGESDGALEARAQEARGDLEALAGRHTRARSAYAAALAGSAERDARARLHRKIGKTWETQHRHERALAAFDRAEDVLGPDPMERAPREWIDLQVDRIAVHYWRAEVDRIAALAGALRPVVEAHGGRAQRDRFFRTLVQLNLRAERYAASSETVAYVQAYVAACERAGDATDVASARCGLGTVRLWHGDLTGAEEALGAALETAERVGDAALRARCLCYLAFAQRRRREVEATRALALRGLAAADDAGMADYAGAARGNLAWVALRESAFADAARLGREAVALWQRLALVFPFQWLARLPLVAAEVESGRDLGLGRHVAALLAPAQARLPEELVEALEACRRSRGMRRRDRARGAIALARRHGYL